MERLTSDTGEIDASRSFGFRPVELPVINDHLNYERRRKFLVFSRVRKIAYAGVSASAIIHADYVAESSDPSPRIDIFHNNYRGVNSHRDHNRGADARAPGFLSLSLSLSLAGPSRGPCYYHVTVPNPFRLSCQYCPRCVIDALTARAQIRAGEPSETRRVASRAWHRVYAPSACLRARVGVQPRAVWLLCVQIQPQNIVTYGAVHETRARMRARARWASSAT